MAKTGPNTPESKAVVRLNAVQHGIFASDPVIPGVEHPDEWQAFRSALVTDRDPQGALEELLAERIAGIAWRLRRVERSEASVIAVGLERVEHDYESADPERGGISRYDLWSGKPRSLSVARANLKTAEACLDLLTNLPNRPSGDLIEDEAIEALFELLEDGDSDALTTPLTGFPKGVRDGGAEGWNVHLLRIALNQLAKARSHTRDELVAWATDTAKARVVVREDELAFVRDEHNRMRRERHLPDRSAMQNITRYESSLNRKLYQALHELEALQARRNGAATPLTRVDIQYAGQ